MNEEVDKINELLVECFGGLDLAKTKAVFLQELASKRSKHSDSRLKEEQPRLLTLAKHFPSKTQKELNLEKELKDSAKKYQQVLHSSKQVLSVAHSLMQMLNSLHETTRNDNVAETVQGFRIQLAKYHRVIQQEGKPEGEPPTEVVMLQHKQRLQRYWTERNYDGVTEVFLSLRVNALQISPELRKNLVYELIRNDLFRIEETEKLDFLLALLEVPHNQLRLAVVAVASIVSSTLRGVEYLTRGGDSPSVVERIIRMCKESAQGSVLQRFCIALLQKCSIKEKLIPAYLAHDLINWLVTMIKKSLGAAVHPFVMDFGSAILANMIHTPFALEHLQQRPEFALKLLETLLRLLQEKIPVSVLMHLLICMSYLSKDQFRSQLEACRFVERISEFVQVYSQINTSQNEAAEIDKRTVLDLCAHMFHPRDATFDNSETMELNQLKTEDRIREYENEQGELIFECFQDEV